MRVITIASMYRSVIAPFGRLLLLLVAVLVAVSDVRAQTSPATQQDGIAAALTFEPPGNAVVRWRFLKPMTVPLTDIVATFNGRPLGVPSVTPYPAPGDRTGILFLLDITAPDRAEQIQKDKIFLLKMAAKAKSYQQVAIGVYDERPRMLLPEDRDPLSVVTMLAATEPKTGLTNLGEALAFASILLMQTGADRNGVVVLTDGHSDDAIDTDLLLARAKAANVSYYFILSGGARPARLEVLKKLSESSGGQIINLDQRDSFENAPFALLDSGGQAQFPMQDVKRLPWESESRVSIAMNYGPQSSKLSMDVPIPTASAGEASLYLVQTWPVLSVSFVIALIVVPAGLLIRLRSKNPAADATGTVDKRITPEPVSAHLTTLEDIELGTIYPITKPLVRIGRNENNDIVLKDPGVGRFHAVVQQVGDQLYSIIDQSSANGTMVNNKKIDTATLVEGDLIALGAKVLRFHRGLR